MRLNLTDVGELHKLKAEFRSGCVVDTNVLFAASTESDRLFDWADQVFITLDTLSMPAFTNQNIRSEFLELQRRVLIPEGLVSFYDEREKESMDLHLKTQLKLLKSNRKKNEDDKKNKDSKRVFRFDDQQIKKFRKLFSKSDSQYRWDLFCNDFLYPTMSRIWDMTIETLNIQFLGTREMESGGYFSNRPNWSDVADIMGRFGIGSADAMIVNFFLCSKFPVIITGDEDVAYAVERLSNGTKYIVVPDSEEENY